MATSQRVSRGFHRLGLFLAAILMLIGVISSAWVALDTANDAKAVHDQQAKLVCAQAALKNAPTPPAKAPPDWGAAIDAAGAASNEPTASASGHPQRPNLHIPPGYPLVPSHDLQALGCSDEPEEVSEADILSATPTDFSYAAVLLPPLGIGLAITLAVSLAVYMLVRVIGWVIGGFAA
jgi:hypothetical protein